MVEAKILMSAPKSSFEGLSAAYLCIQRHQTDNSHYQQHASLFIFITKARPATIGSPAPEIPVKNSSTYEFQEQEERILELVIGP